MQLVQDEELMNMSSAATTALQLPNNSETTQQHLVLDPQQPQSSQFEQAFDSKLYSSVVAIFELPPQVLLSIYSENFMQALITNSMCEESEFNI